MHAGNDSSKSMGEKLKGQNVFIVGASEYILIVLVIAVLFIIARRSANSYKASANKKHS
jgi:hypothetical protein